MPAFGTKAQLNMIKVEGVSVVAQISAISGACVGRSTAVAVSATPLIMAARPWLRGSTL